MAAYSRFASLSSNDDAPDGMAAIPWSLVTPEESDQSELCECIMEGLESLVEDGGSAGLLGSDCAAVSSDNRTDGHTTTIIADRWVDEMVSQGSVRNWREIANADSSILRSVLSRRDMQSETENKNAPKTEPKPLTKTNDSIHHDHDTSLVPLSIESIDAWIEAAQTQSIN